MTLFFITPALALIAFWLVRRPAKLACRVFGHEWFHARGYSTNRHIQHCLRCNKQEFL